MTVDLALGITLTQDPTNTPSGWTNPANVNDGNVLTTAGVPYTYAPSGFTHRLVADLGADADVSSMWSSNSDGGGDQLDSPAYSNDGSSWTTIAGSWGAKTSHNGTLMRQFSITGAPITHRYFRLGKIGAGIHVGYVWGNWEIIGVYHAAALVAAFTGTPVLGAAPLLVAFTDQTSGTPDGWSWDFGDGGTSSSQNPSHTYTVPGRYDVVLTATRSSDSASDMATRTEYVIVVESLAGVFADWDGDGFDVGDHDDISSAGNVIRWEIHRGSGAEITGGSQPGSAILTAKNPSDIYNPRNASSPLYPNVTDGVPIWIGPNSDGVLTGSDPRGLFGGRITDVTLIPSEGPGSVPTVEISCEDALSWYQRTPVVLDYAEGRSHNQLRGEALAAAGETRYDLAHEIQTMPLSHADSNLGSVLDAINAINGTRHFAKPSDLYTDWFRYTTRNRQYRLDATIDASLSASADHVTGTDGWRLSADTVTNRQKATVTPIKFTPATFTVWQADLLPIEITDLRPYSRIVDFDDVVSGSFLNIASTGDTVTAVYTPFASAGKIELTVAAGDAATITALSVEGSLARRLEQQSYQADDTVSQALPRGIREGSEIGNEYLGTIEFAEGIARHVVWRYGNPQLRPTLTVINWLPDQFDLDLYDVIAFTSSQLGMSAVLFEIVGLSHIGELAALDENDDPLVLHTVEYVLQESRVQTDPNWFYLDSGPNSSVLDSATFHLAY